MTRTKLLAAAVLTSCTIRGAHGGDVTERSYTIR
jgi:hypothetical protein